MRLIQTSSRWGSCYRFRYYIDGKRVSLDRWLDNIAKDWRKVASQSTSYGYRDVWEIEA